VLRTAVQECFCTIIGGGPCCKNLSEMRLQKPSGVVQLKTHAHSRTCSVFRCCENPRNTCEKTAAPNATKRTTHWALQSVAHEYSAQAKAYVLSGDVLLPFLFLHKRPSSGIF
jgi:hypothetical protein